MAPAHSRVSRNTGLWLVNTSHVTWILISDWSSYCLTHQPWIIFEPHQTITSYWHSQASSCVYWGICYLTKYPRHSVFFGQTGRWDFSRIENQEAYTLPEQKQNWSKCRQSSTWVIVNNLCHFLLASLSACIQVFVFNEE